MTTDHSIPARQGRLIETFLAAGYDPSGARAAAAELHDLTALPHATTLVWTLTVGNRTATFPARPDGSLCDPLVLGAVIEQNRVDDTPTHVTVEAILVGGHSKQETPWPVEADRVVPLLESMAAKPDTRTLERSDIKKRVTNLGRAGKVGYLIEHDHDPSRRWRLPRARAFAKDRSVTVQVGWWDHAVTFMWFAP